MKLILGAVATVFLSIGVAGADIFRYTDESGAVYYTDVPIHRTAERIMKTGPASLPKAEVREVRSEQGRPEFSSIVSEKAAKYDLDPSLIHAVIKAESNGNPRAVSRKGARGLMQLMPGTASDLQVRNAFDPEENIDGGTRYLKGLIEKFNGDLTLALAAYNAGPKTVEKTGTVPSIPETKHYVRKVLSLYNGKTYIPVTAGTSAPPAPKERPERIYKVLAEDGTVLFTNLPVNRSSPRF